MSRNFNRNNKEQESLEREDKLNGSNSTSNGSGSKSGSGKGSRDDKSRGRNNGRNKKKTGNRGPKDNASDGTGNSNEKDSNEERPQLNRNSDIHDGTVIGNNDPSWYNKHVSVIGNLTNLNYSYASGRTWSLKGKNFTIDVNTPGAMKFELTPAIGYNDSVTSPLNSASSILYMQITGTKSGKAPFDHADCMMYNLAVGSIYSFVGWVQRAYGLIKMYSMDNQYMPRALFEHMGLDYDAWTNDLANFRAKFNVLLTRVQIWPSAVNYDYFKREYWKYSCVYTEGPSLKDQFYYFNPKGFYVYNESDPDVDYSSKLTVQQIGTSMTPNDILNFLETMINRLFESGSMMLVGSWLASYYGGVSLNSLSPLDDTIVTIPIYRPEVLYQMKNATVLGQDLIDTEVTQDPLKGYIIADPRMLITSAGKTLRIQESYTNDQLLESAMDLPTADDNIINTRMKMFLGDRVTEDVQIYHISCFMEVVTGCTIMEVRTKPTFTYKFYKIRQYSGSGAVMNDENTVNSLHALAAASNFKFHPCIYVLDIADSLDLNTVYRFFDVDNWTIVTRELVDSINQAAMYSLFDIPVLGGSYAIKPSYDKGN